ncbi:MAG: S46 family peptidase [Pirellula sp.]
MKSALGLVLVCLSCHLVTSDALGDEGMFPISELGRLKLKEKGMHLTPEELFNANQVSLVDGICRVNGCTGSFVSNDGLIITNHHCAFDAIQKASSSANDLLERGFIANSRSEELAATGYTVRITQGYADVSSKVLSVVRENMTYLQRTEAIEKRRKEVEKAAEEENKGLRAEVAEMFAGKTYVLFLYTYLKDVRLVFAPPVSIGAFGGETDNWEWPRHTGDFSFMRAYSAPDGSSAEYSPKNVPFHPKRFIKVAPQGVNEEDFVFLLGYPGRTVRQKTASFFRYEQNIRLPAVVELYGWQIQEMDKAGAADRAVAIKHASRTKSLANVEKRSRGQLLGLRRTGMVASRDKQESEFQAYVEAGAQRKSKYGSLLRDIDEVYQQMSDRGPFEIHFKELRSACRTLAIAFMIYDAAIERAKPDLEREAPYMNRNFELSVQQLKLDIADLDPSTDIQMLRGMLNRLSRIPATQEIQPLSSVLSSREFAGQKIEGMIKSSKLGQFAFVEPLLKATPSELASVDDPALRWMIQLYPTYRKLRDTDKERDGRLGQLYGTLMEAKQMFQPADFVPDANATLRITYGRVRGYSPSDAIQKAPISTLQGVIDKTTGIEPFITPKEALDRFHAKEFGPFVHPKLLQVPVAILYNTDTTGGNSGSPVLNARGELVGVNFDRTFEATINDFAWNESYSRSIGVDIRYVLWVTGIVYKAKHLLDEMGVAL